MLDENRNRYRLDDNKDLSAISRKRQKIKSSDELNCENPCRETVYLKKIDELTRWE